MKAIVICLFKALWTYCDFYYCNLTKAASSVACEGPGPAKSYSHAHCEQQGQWSQSLCRVKGAA